MAKKRRCKPSVEAARESKKSTSSPRRLMVVCLAVVMLSGLAFVLLRAKRPSAPPNIVLIVVDTLRADHLGSHGYTRNTTPNIDRLAADGVLCTSAISPAPWTLPAVATLLTSQYPSALGIRDKPVAIRPGFPSLAQLLKPAGYVTRGIVSHDLLSAQLGFGRGFDVYDESSIMGHRGSSSRAVTDRALAFLSDEPEEPFFLMVHYFDPHYNFQLHSQYDYLPAYDGDIKSGESILRLWAKRHSMSADDIAFLNALYDSEIAWTDQHIGRLLEELRRSERYRDALIVLTADHGEEFMERGWIGHSITLFQELIAVPLIFKLPGGAAGVVETPVGLIDVTPTILHFAGLDIPDGLDGVPLELDSAGVIGSRPIFSETFNPQVHRPEPVEPLALSSVVLGTNKLILNEITGEAQFFDLQADIGEQSELSGSPLKARKIMEKLIREWRSYVETKARKPPSESTLEGSEELFTPEQVERLKALGYL